MNGILEAIVGFLAICLSTTPEKSGNKITFNGSWQRFIVVGLVIILVKFFSK